jgi:methionyl-tRNA formyltransferase
MEKRAGLNVFLFSAYNVSYETIHNLLDAGIRLKGVLVLSSQPTTLGWGQRLRNLASFGSFREPSSLLKKHAIPLYRVDDYNGPEAEQALRDASTDILLLYGSKIIKPNILAIPRVGTLNAHSSLLPKYRGSASEFWMLLNDERQYAGITVHWVDPGLDTGDIFLQRSITAPPGITPRELRAIGRPIAAQLLTEAVLSIERGEVKRVKQDESQATKFKRPTPEDVDRFNKKYARN